MEILILKNGYLYATVNDASAKDTDTYSMLAVKTLPSYPDENAGVGKQWVLDFSGEEPMWVQKERELTTEERLERIEADFETIKYAWKAGEAVEVGDRRYSEGIWYTCLQAHTTQEDWKPALVPALWRAE